MRLSISAVALTALASSAQAFKDTSPFLMFSNSPLPESMSDVSKSQLQSSSAVLQSAKDFLKSCPSEIYYIISQPSVTSHEVSSSMHHLKMAVENPAVKARFSVNQVAGLKEGDVDSLLKYIETTCGAVRRNPGQSVDAAFKTREGKSVVIDEVMSAFEGDSEQRAEALSDNDSALYTSILADLPKGYKYTVIFTTTPTTSVVDHQKAITYDPEFQEAFHMDLKRNFYASGRKNETNSTDFRPLFEKYNYFSPGLFMTLSVSLVLLAILSVGVSAIASLEVSYGAFDKEMGPAAQKKP